MQGCKANPAISTFTAANQEALLLCPLSMPVDFLFSEDGAGSRNEKGDEGVEHGGSEHSNFNTGQWLCSKALCCQSMGGHERHGKSVHNHVTQVQSNSGSILWRWEERCGARACNCRLPDPAAWIHPEQPLHDQPAVQACTSCEVAPAVQHSSMRGPRHTKSAAPG